MWFAWDVVATMYHFDVYHYWLSLPADRAAVPADCHYISVTFGVFQLVMRSAGSNVCRNCAIVQQDRNLSCAERCHLWMSV
jgi:hypothetical protein